MNFSAGKRFVQVTGWLKYLIALALFVGFTGFVGEHCVKERIVHKQDIRVLRTTIATEQARFAQDKAELDLLRSDLDEVRRVARESYFMHKTNEDVFIIMDE